MPWSSCDAAAADGAVSVPGAWWFRQPEGKGQEEEQEGRQPGRGQEEEEQGAARPGGQEGLQRQQREGELGAVTSEGQQGQRQRESYGRRHQFSPDFRGGTLPGDGRGDLCGGNLADDGDAAAVPHSRSAATDLDDLLGGLSRRAGGVSGQGVVVRGGDSSGEGGRSGRHGSSSSIPSARLGGGKVTAGRRRPSPTVAAAPLRQGAPKPPVAAAPLRQGAPPPAADDAEPAPGAPPSNVPPSPGGAAAEGEVDPTVSFLQQVGDRPVGVRSHRFRRLNPTIPHI